MKRLPLLLAVLLALSGVPARATQCNVTVTPVLFGFYDPLSPVPLDTTGTINVTCQTPAKHAQTVTIQLTAGNSGNFAQRSMAPFLGGSGALYYNLYVDPSMATVLGDGSGGSASLTNTVHRTAPWAVTIHGRLLPLQRVPTGAYADALTVTILW